MNFIQSKKSFNWWGRIKIAADEWKETAKNMGIPQEVVDWSEKATGGRAGQLWFAILASKNPPEIVPGEDDEQVADLINDFFSYKNLLSEKRLELYASKSEFTSDVERIKKILEPEKSTWRATHGNDMRPMVVRKTQGGDTYEVIYIQRKDCNRLIGTDYCVARGVTYNPDRYYLVVKNGKIYSLVHPESGQNKNIKDVELTGCDEGIAAAMVSLAIGGKNEWLNREMRSGVKSCKSGEFGTVLEIVMEADPSIIDDGSIMENPTGVGSLLLAKHEGKLSVPDDSPLLPQLKQAMERIRKDASYLKMVLGLEMRRSSNWVDFLTTTLSPTGFINILMLIYKDAKTRRDEKMLQFLREAMNGFMFPYESKKSKNNFFASDEALNHHEFVNLKPQLVTEFATALRDFGMTNLAEQVSLFGHQQLAAWHIRNKQKIDDARADALLASGNIPLIINYYLHGAHRGMTISNQMPNTGKPWPALEKLAVDMCMSNPSGSYTILRMYLPAVADPIDRLRGMIKMAAESSREGIGDAFDLVVPKEWKKLLAAQG